MIPFPESPEPSRFNSPAEMRARLAVVVVIGSTVLAIASLPLVFITGHWAWLVVGGAAGAVACALREHLKVGDRWQAANDSLDALATGAEASEESARLATLMALLREWDRLEQGRGAPGFDPWAVQAVRREIRVVVTEDPALARLFDLEPITENKRVA